jgi:hypothetical protein
MMKWAGAIIEVGHVLNQNQTTLVEVRPPSVGNYSADKAGFFRREKESEVWLCHIKVPISGFQCTLGQRQVLRIDRTIPLAHDLTDCRPSDSEDENGQKR